jgi:hypothetical protein
MLNHITLTSGHVRESSPRSEVSDEAVAELIPWIKKALSDSDFYPIPMG